MSWSSRVSNSEVARRAGGRRRYNAWRQDMRQIRRRDVLLLLHKYGLRRGVQARIAKTLGVSEATITRDIQASVFSLAVCPTCSAYRPTDFKLMTVTDQ